MGRIIEDSVKGDFPPMVGLRTIGNYVKGKVLELGETKVGNPTVTLSLLDLDGSTSKSVAKGQYEEVEVSEGDRVQVVGSVAQLKEKLPQLQVGDIVTITHVRDEKVRTISKETGKPITGNKQIFRVEVE
jgi:hypothetical protein